MPLRRPHVAVVALSAALPLLLSSVKRAPADPAAVTWLGDLDAARSAARQARKPLLVLFRCANDKRLAALDAAVTRPDDPELARLLAERFVCARVMSLKGVDLNTFRFDYDRTLAAVVLDPASGRTLTRWGVPGGDSATALKHALARVADGYRPDAAPADPSKPFTVADYPGFAGTKRAGEFCYHCHYAYDARFAAERRAGTFRKAELWLYPPPENAGLTLDGDRNNVVASVRAGSPAAAAGVKAGDVLERAGETRVYTAADLQTALNDVPDPGTLRLAVSRAGKPVPPVMLRLPKGWRETDISWRPSQGAIPPLVGIWEEPLTDAERRAAGIAPGKVALRITTLFSGERWAKTYGGLRRGDVIVAVGGRELPAMSPRQFHAWFRMNHEVGGTATFTVLRDGARADVPVPCVDVSFD